MQVELNKEKARENVKKDLGKGKSSVGGAKGSKGGGGAKKK